VRVASRLLTFGLVVLGLVGCSQLAPPAASNRPGASTPQATRVATGVAQASQAAGVANTVATPGTTAVAPVATDPIASPKSADRLVISQVTDAAGLSTINPIERLHTLLPRSLIYDQLLTRDRDGIQPMLAESVTAIDPRRYRIVVRRGVVFHNGEPLDAASVKATFEFLATAPEGGLFRRYFVGFQSAEIVDDRTVELRLEAPNVLVMAGLTQVPILPASQLANDPVKQLAERRLIGSGPYKLASFSPNDSVTLAAFDGYWGGKPPFRELILKHIPEAATRIAELRSGTARIIGDVPASKVAEIEQIPGARIVTEAGIRSAYLMISPHRTPLDNPKVRQAIYAAVDRKELVEGLFGQFAEAATSPAPPASEGSTPVFPLTDFNRDRARALLKEAGVALPLTVDVDVAQVYLDVAQVIQAQLKEVGIEVTINPIESVPAVTDPKRIQAKPAPTMALHVGFDNIERDAYYTMYAYSGTPDGFATRFGYPPNPAFDAMLTRYLGTPDRVARTELARDGLTLMKEAMPIVWLYYPLRVYAVAPGIDFSPRGDGQLHAQDVRPR
jgi:peptide/nickel transport system substrate-binding protein